MAEETRVERLDRLDRELAARLNADREEEGDAELARLFPDLAQPAEAPDPRKRVPRGETSLQRFLRLERDRKAGEAVAEAEVIADIDADEKASNPTFLQNAVAPATTGLRSRQSQLDLAIEGSDELQRLKSAQSTDAQN